MQSQENEASERVIGGLAVLLGLLALVLLVFGYPWWALGVGAVGFLVGWSVSARARMSQVPSRPGMASTRRRGVAGLVLGFGLLIFDLVMLAWATERFSGLGLAPSCPA